MNRYIDRKVKIGNRNYTYNKEENGKDTLITNEQVDDKKIKIVLKGGTEKSIKDVEQLIIEVLGDQYIQRNLESLI